MFPKQIMRKTAEEAIKKIKTSGIKYTKKAHRSKTHEISIINWEIGDYKLAVRIDQKKICDEVITVGRITVMNVSKFFVHYWYDAVSNIEKYLKQFEMNPNNCCFSEVIPQYCYICGRRLHELVMLPKEFMFCCKCYNKWHENYTYMKRLTEDFMKKICWNKK